MRIAVGVPSVWVADPAYNADQTVALIRDAADRKAVLALFPELGMTAYSCDDLFQQRALLDACLDAIAAVAEATAKLAIVSVIGAPLQIDNHLFNCASRFIAGRFSASCRRLIFRTTANSTSRGNSPRPTPRLATRSISPGAAPSRSATT